MLNILLQDKLTGVFAKITRTIFGSFMNTCANSEEPKHARALDPRQEESLRRQTEREDIENRENEKIDFLKKLEDQGRQKMISEYLQVMYAQYGQTTFEPSKFRNKVAFIRLELDPQLQRGLGLVRCKTILSQRPFCILLHAACKETRRLFLSLNREKRVKMA